MLILTIPQDGILRIGDETTIQVSRKIDPEELTYTNQIRFAIDAPDDVTILREELTEEDPDQV